MKDLISIAAYSGKGIGAMVHCGDFLVSILNHIPRLCPEQTVNMQKHTLTDECFVLLSGKALIYLADGTDAPKNICLHPLEQGKIYTVHKGVWHSPILSEDAKVLLVEREDTAESNSPRVPLTELQIAYVKDLGKVFTKEG